MGCLCCSCCLHSSVCLHLARIYAFNIWTTLSRGWAFVAAAFIIIVPMYQEVTQILKQIAKNKQDKLSSADNVNSETLLKNSAPNSPQNTPYHTAAQSSNKHEYIFQRLRNTLSR